MDLGRWLIIVCFVMAWVSANDVRAQPLEGQGEIEIAPDSFVRGAPLPPWVRQVAAPSSKSSSPLVIRLHDTQFKVAPVPTV